MDGRPTRVDAPRRPGAATAGALLIGFVQLERRHVTEVYVAAHHRRAGYGTTLGLAAIADAGDVRDLWICADDDGSAKYLYARLGFRPVWTTMEFERLAVTRPCPAV